MFCHDNVCFLRLLHIFNFRLDFIIEATTMNPDQTAPLILAHIVWNIGYLRTQTEDTAEDKVLTGGKGV